MNSFIMEGSAMEARRDRLFRDKSHDPTRRERKLADPTVCPDCGATYTEGRWTWEPAPPAASQTLCSACERVRDDYPAGFITIAGDFVHKHREEILQLARNVEAREKAEHPIKRIMTISKESDPLQITTTDIHLAQGIGRALASAFKGDLEIDFEEDIVRVVWRRDE